MARVQLKKSEQISPNMSIVIDYDQPITKRADILKIYSEALGEKCMFEKFGGSDVFYYTHDNKKEYFLTSAVTWLSGPHPAFKKRLQLKKWYKDFYEMHKDESNSEIHIIGIYHYDGMVLFVELEPLDYLEKKMNSSAAHVYSNDLYQALKQKKFTRIDKNKNHITVIASRNFKEYLEGNIKEESLFTLFEKFNEGFSFGEWITAINAIQEMKNKNWYQWKGTEWAGWLLEYKMNEFIEEEDCSSQMKYIGNMKNKDEYLDFDLFFPKDDFYGDLKASDISKKESPGNDQENVLDALAKYGRLWYVIYEHETEKDINHNSEMAIARMELIGTPYKPGGKISYKSRMKHSVNFQRMKIFELNQINMHEVLKEFNQGHQPSGEKRAPKFAINKKNIDNFVVYSYDFSE